MALKLLFSGICAAQAVYNSQVIMIGTDANQASRFAKEMKPKQPSAAALGKPYVSYLYSENNYGDEGNMMTVHVPRNGREGSPEVQALIEKANLITIFMDIEEPETLRRAVRIRESMHALAGDREPDYLLVVMAGNMGAYYLENEADAYAFFCK